MVRPLCIGCLRRADEIPEYALAAKRSELTAEEFVRLHEGTYNPQNGHFLCTQCYVAADMPAVIDGWRAP